VILLIEMKGKFLFYAQKAYLAALVWKLWDEVIPFIFYFLEDQGRILLDDDYSHFARHPP
tara:strand:- start:200 stop:379 length:180 start_codon:yes stop_codon:yes gene_type:complete